ncbi:MAG: translocation and assembly module TamA [Crocinitomix sp.]|jgi:translocation and assembly module TamA
MRQICIIIFHFLFTSALYGQEAKNVHYHLDKLSVKVKVTKDSTRKTLDREAAINQFRMNGYLGIQPTDTIIKRGTIHYYFSFENQFKRVALIETGRKRNRITVQKNLQRTVEEINAKITQLENHGFPFARLEIIQQEEKDKQLNLTYKIDSGAYFIIDKIHIKSKTDFNEKTVLSIMGIKPGEPYNEEKIRNLSAIFQNTAIYNTPRPPELLFKQGLAELYVYIEKKKSSSADGYVGFQQDKVSERLVLNGFINLELKNALNRAETIHLNWKNNPDKTQDLKTIVEYPYLFGSPVGVGANIDLQKQDTSFVRSDLLFELIYRNPQFRIAIFDQIEASSTISAVPIAGFRDFSKNTIGLSVQYRPFLPDNLSFYHPQFTISGGVFNYRADTLDDETRKIANNKYLLKYEHSIDFLKYFHLNNSLQYQGLASSINLSRNEFIYFGGLQSVRGFYELELAGRENWVVRNEIEFRPIELLSLKVLYDYSNFRGESKNYTHSAGIGFGLINNSSQLEIIVANGVLNDNPFALSDTKVHIGFKSNF